MNAYGKELILDLHDCDTPFSRRSIMEYMKGLCSLIDMEWEDLHFWDYEGDPEGYEEAPPHLKGISAVQFIKTSNITIHTLDDLGKVFVNVFSCKSFDCAVVERFTVSWFDGYVVNHQEIQRI